MRQFIKTHSRPRAISLGYVNPQDLEGDLEEPLSPTGSFGFVEPDESEQGQDHQTPTRSLWIGNLPGHVTSADLMQIFTPYGQIESLRVLPERECAFVNYMTVEEALKARDDVKGARIAGSAVKVGFGKADIFGPEQQNLSPARALWVGNISAHTTPQLLHSVFSPFGPIESARVLTHKNCGFVNFDREEDAVRAKTVMNGQEIAGAIVRIGFAKVPSKAESTGTGTIQGSQTPPLNPNFAFPAVRPLSAQSKNLEGDNWRATAHPNITPTVATFKDKDKEKEEEEEEEKEKEKEEREEIESPEYRDLLGFEYSSNLPPLPDGYRRIDQSRLREIRKRLEGHCTSKDIDNAFFELYEDCVELSYDYIGNTVIQKLMEKGTDQHKLKMIEKIAPHIASIGIHKNGTWAIQKMIDTARTPAQMALICQNIKPYTPPLMLDQFGNYVVQCCLRLGNQRNQFIFDAMYARCLEIAQGRFGSRAMRTCLESQHTTKSQQKLVAAAIVQNSVELCTNPNGAILLTWLLDLSALQGRFRGLAPHLVGQIAPLCIHKMASLTILKVINQNSEPDARDIIINALVFSSEKVLEDVLNDQVHGVGVVHKILVSIYVSEIEKTRIAEKVKTVLNKMQVGHIQGYRRLYDELSLILGTQPAVKEESPVVEKEATPPLFNPLMMPAQAPSSPSAANFAFPGMYNPMFNPQFALMSMMSMNPQMMQANAAYMMQNPAFAQMMQQQMQQIQQMMQSGGLAPAEQPPSSEAEPSEKQQ